MSTNTVVAVPTWAQDYVKQYGQMAYDLWNQPALVAYGGSIVAAQPQNEADGIQALAIRGAGGDEVISKATAFILDVIQGNRLAGTKQEFIDALALVTGNSTTDFASVSSRIGKKARYVGDPDGTFLAQALAAAYPALFNARVSAAIYADNYAKERVFLDHALAYGVEMGKHPVIDAETLRKAGLRTGNISKTPTSWITSFLSSSRKCLWRTLRFSGICSGLSREASRPRPRPIRNPTR